MIRVTTLLVTGIVTPATAQLTARAAYDTVQRIRAEAESLLVQGRPGAVDHLRRAFAFLQEPAVQDLAYGWPYLRSRASNVWWDIAVAATAARDSSTALDALEHVEATGGSSAYIDWIQTDTLVRRWRNHPRVTAVIARLAQDRRLTRDSAFVTPYRDTLPVAERVAGLSLVWAEVRYGYPDFATHPDLDWDAHYRAFLPEVLAAQDSYAYFRTLQRFVAGLGDAHTNVYFPPEINARLGRPPLRTQLVEGRVLVTTIRSPSIEALGIRLGDEILTIDGIPVHEYAEREVGPYQASSSPQDRAVRLYTYFLFLGPRSTPIRLGIRHADGTESAVVVPRDGYRDIRPLPRPVTDSILPGHIGYLRIATFGNDSVSAWSLAAMARLMNTRGLIIDIRENDGGNTTVGPLAILARNSSPMASARVRNYSALERARGFESQPFELGNGWIRPDRRRHYDAPVVLLIGPRTFSAGEDFAVAFDLMRRGTIVGEPSGGNTGQPLSFVLPGGGFARVRTKHDYYGDGRTFLFTGIQPQVLVRPTVAGVRAGRDEALEAAVRVLREPPAGRGPEFQLNRR